MHYHIYNYIARPPELYTCTCKPTFPLYLPNLWYIPFQAIHFPCIAIIDCNAHSRNYDSIPTNLYNAIEDCKVHLQLHHTGECPQVNHLSSI